MGKVGTSNRSKQRTIYFVSNFISSSTSRLHHDVRARLEFLILRNILEISREDNSAKHRTHCDPLCIHVVLPDHFYFGAGISV